MLHRIVVDTVKTVAALETDFDNLPLAQQARVEQVLKNAPKVTISVCVTDAADGSTRLLESHGLDILSVIRKWQDNGSTWRNVRGNLVSENTQNVPIRDRPCLVVSAIKPINASDRGGKKRPVGPITGCLQFCFCSFFSCPLLAFLSKLMQPFDPSKCGGKPSHQKAEPITNVFDARHRLPNYQEGMSAGQRRDGRQLDRSPKMVFVRPPNQIYEKHQHAYHKQPHHNHRPTRKRQNPLRPSVTGSS